MMQDTIDTLAAMSHQEDTGYVTNDWTELSCHGPLHEIVDRDCRNQMAAWCFQVVAACKLSHESVEITMSLVDRFLSTPQGAAARNDRWAFQLACMGALYTSVKIHEPQAMTPNLIARLSNGAYSAADIESMEVKLLGALNWRVNPPTAHAVSRHLMDLMPAHVLNSHMRQVVLDLAVLQIELSISHSLFLTAKASTLAYSAVMNALESLGLDDKTLGQVGTALAQPLQLRCNSEQVVQMQKVMYKTLAHQRSAACPPSTHIATRRMSLKDHHASVEVSPRAIAYSQ
jgi:hypothetical protein